MLKRTCCPFYGKTSKRLEEVTRRMAALGDWDSAVRLRRNNEALMRARRLAHRAREKHLNQL